MCRVFYIDPQSYKNLSVYDYELLRNITGAELVYFHNVKYQLEEFPCAKHEAMFSYSDRRGIAKGLSYVMSVMKIMYRAWREHPQVVHIQWFRLFAIDSLFVRFLKARGIKIVHTAHNVLPHSAKRRDVKHYAWYYNNVDAIIVHTERTKEELQELFAVGEKVAVIPHGLLPANVDEATVETRAEQLRRELHSEGKIVFASLGFQNYYKGIDIIADVWCRAFSNDERCMLLVVGKTMQGVELGRLRECKNVVVKDEVVGDVDFDAYLRLTSVALLPYRKISQSGVLLTCLQRGVPVVVSDVGGLTDPLRYARVGWSIGEASQETLSSMMQRLVDEPALLSSVAHDSDAFNRLREVYSWKNIGQATADLYSSISHP